MPVLNDTPGRQLVSQDLKDVFTILSKTTAYTARFNDFVLADASSGAFIVTLPTVVNANKGARIVVKKTDISANIVTIATEDIAQIDGTDTILIVSQYKNYTMVTDGANWHV